MRAAKSIGIVVLFLFICISTYSATPQLINYQAAVSNSAGNPLDTTVTVIFSIYDGPSSLIPLWSETHNSLVISEGRLSVLLGTITPISDQLFSDTGRYIGIKIGGDNEMTPRSRLLSVPYALRLETIDGASGGNVSGALRISPDPAKVEGDALIVANANGTTILSVKASSQGVALVSLFDPVDSKDGAIAVPIERVVIQPEGIKFFDTTGTDTTATFSTDGDAYISGPVGIGTASPAAALHVSGTTRTTYLEGDQSNDLNINNSVSINSSVTGATGVHSWYTNGSEKVRITNAGKVGIGTSSPSQMLHVTDNARVDDTLFTSNVSSLSPLRLQTGGTTRMTIDDAGGFVGIGTESPLSDLHIQSTNPISTNIRIFNTSASGDPGISFLSSAAFQFTLGVDNSDFDKFKISAGSTLGASERLTISGAGNVGIGTNAPAYKLEVSGPVMMEDAAAPSASAGHSGVYSSGGELFAIDSGGNTTQLSPHDTETGEWIFYSKNIKTGRVVRVDMEKLVRKIEQLTGEQFLVETWEKQE